MKRPIGFYFERAGTFTFKKRVFRVRVPVLSDMVPKHMRVGLIQVLTDTICGRAWININRVDFSIEK